MIDRTIVVSGPFTDAEVARVVRVLQDIEGHRPNSTFRLVLDEGDASSTATETLKRLRAINPLRPGYQRIVEINPE